MIYKIIIFLLLANSSFAQEISSEQFISNLINKGELTILDQPTISVFQSECTSFSKPPLGNETEFMCDIVTSSEHCKGVEKNDLLNCSDLNDSKDFDVIEFLAGCTTGLFDSVKALLSFIWDALKWVWEKTTTPSDSLEESSEYMDSVKLYLTTEYDKAYDEVSSPFRTIKAAKSVASSIGKMLLSNIQDYLQKEYKSFGCMNFKARTETICKVAGEFLLPPTAALALLKRGAGGVKASKELKGFLSGKRYNNSLKKRKQLGESALNRKLSDSEVSAIQKAHLVGAGKNGKNGKPAGVGNYTLAQLNSKARVLKDAGFSKREVRDLMENGVVGVSSSGFFSLFKRNRRSEVSEVASPNPQGSVERKMRSNERQASVKEDVSTGSSQSIETDNLAIGRSASLNGSRGSNNTGIIGDSIQADNIVVGNGATINTNGGTRRSLNTNSKNSPRESSGNSGISLGGGTVKTNNLTIDGKRVAPGTYSGNIGSKGSGISVGGGTIKVGK